MEVAHAAAYLGPISDTFVFLTGKVHPIWFPYAWGPTLHAARVSVIFQANSRRSPTALSWGQYVTGFLIMAWGGGLLSHLLLGIPAPMLYSIHPAINYVSVHVFLTLLFSAFPALLNPALLDTILWPLDAFLRTNGIISTLALFSHPSVDSEYRNSALTHLIVGALASAGGGVSIGTIGGFTHSWSFGTPPFLRAGAGWAGTLDVWGGALVALIYGSLINDPAFDGVKTFATLILSSSPTSSIRKPHADADTPPLPPLPAKAIAGVVLAIFFAARTYKAHWVQSTPVLPPVQASPPQPAPASKPKTKPAAAAKPKKTEFYVEVPPMPTPSPSPAIVPPPAPAPAPASPIKTRKRRVQASKTAS